MTNSIPAGETLSAAVIRAAFSALAQRLGDAATLTFHPESHDETLTLTPANPRSVEVSFEYGTEPEGAGEVRFDIAGADEPVYDLGYMIELTQAAIAGRVIVAEDWLRREVTITSSSGQDWKYQATGLLGALLFKRNWRPRARITTFEPYRANLN